MSTATGALFGLAYGDALGRPTEFLSVPEIVSRYGAGGPAEPEGDPALVTDDTQMALAVAWALREAPSMTPDALAPLLVARFVAWSTSPDNNRAPGNTCMHACGALGRGMPWLDASVVGSKGCGANMRVAPVGLVPGLPLDALAGTAQLQAALTHGHPAALAASELTAYAVRILCDGTPLVDVPAALRARAEEQGRVYRADWLGELWLRGGAASPADFVSAGWNDCVRVLDRLDSALARGDREVDPCLATGAGWVAEEALATGLLCALLFADEPVAGLRRAAVSSGDSDSIACLAGSFLGAAHGMSAWPVEWAHRIEYRDQLATLGRGWDRP